MGQRFKTGEYALVVECIEAIMSYFESAFLMGFSDTNVWYAMASDGVPVDPETPDDIYKIDTADLVTCIHYLLDHRRRLVDALELIGHALHEGEDLHLSRRLVLEVIASAKENRPGPFENGAGAQDALPGLETEEGEP